MTIRNLVLVAILFVICGNVFAEDVQVTFISAKNNSKEIKYYDIDTEVFTLGYGSSVSSIENLHLLPNLKEVQFTGTAFLNDFSFFYECKNFEVIILYDVHANEFSFLYSLPNLKILDIQSAKYSKMIDMTKLKTLEYIAMVNCGISSLKDFVSHGESLQYVNVSTNNIMSVDGKK